MAFPVVAARITGRTTNTNTNTHAITLPAGVVAGDLLVVVFSVDGNPTVTASQAGWTKLGQASSTTVATGAIFYKVATGSDALTLTTSAVEASSHASYRITGAASTITATSANAATANTDPPAHTPPGGAKDYLWIATRSADSTNVATVAPTGYANLQTQAATGTGGASTNAADRSLNAASENPGTFTSTAIAWVAWTIAVEPAPPPAQSRTMDVLASTATVANPQVIAPQTLVTASFAATSTVATPTITRTLTVVLAAVAATSAPAAPTVTATKLLTTVTVAASSLVAAPTVIGAQSFTAAVVASAASVGLPSVAVRYPITVASTAAVPAPTVATHYPVTVGPASTVSAPTPIAWVRPIVKVNKPTVTVPSAGLAPSSTLLPSLGNDRVYPPTLAGGLFQTAPLAPVESAALVEAPSLTISGVTVSPAVVASSAVVGAPTLDVLTQYRRPQPLLRVLTPKTTLTTGTHLVPTAQPDAVYPPRAYVGALQVLELVSVPSTATVAAPAQPPTASPTVVAATSAVFPPTLRAHVYPATIPGLPSSGVTLYPSPNLYPSPDLFPFKAQVPHLAAAPTVRMVPATAASTAVVAAPALTGSGVNVIPLLSPAAISSASSVATPVVWVEPLAVEIEFLDSEEDVENPDVILPGANLVRAQPVASTVAIELATVQIGSVTLSPVEVLSTSTVATPRAITVPTIVINVRFVSAMSTVGRPHIAEPGEPGSLDMFAGAPRVTVAFRTGVPVTVYPRLSSLSPGGSP